MKIVVTHIVGPGDAIQIESSEHDSFGSCVREVREAIHDLGPKSIAWKEVLSLID